MISWLCNFFFPHTKYMRKKKTFKPLHSINKSCWHHLFKTICLFDFGKRMKFNEIIEGWMCESPRTLLEKVGPLYRLCNKVFRTLWGLTLLGHIGANQKASNRKLHLILAVGNYFLRLIVFFTFEKYFSSKELFRFVWPKSRGLYRAVKTFEWHIL